MFAELVAERRDRAFEQRLHRCSDAERVQIRQQARAQFSRVPIRRVERHAPASRARIGGIETAEHLQHDRKVRHRTREHADAIDPARAVHHSDRRDFARRRFQAIDAAMAGRNAHRAERVGAERERGEARRDRDGGTAGRTARRIALAQRVLHGRAVWIRARCSECALVERGFAQDDRAGAAEPRHGGGVLRGDVSAATRQTRARGEAGDVEIVLDRDRQPVEPADAATLFAARGALGCGFCGAFVERDIGIQPRIFALDRGTMGCGEADAVDAPEASQCSCWNAVAPRSTSSAISSVIFSAMGLP